MLFILYINDMHRSTGVFNAIHFADDTTLYHRGTDLKLMELVANEQLRKVDQWLCVNRLSLNIKKTTYMIFANKNISNIDISIRTNTINRVNKHKFLGVIIDEKLKFSEQINMVASKVSRSLGVLRRIQNLVPSHIIRNLFFSLIYSHITYAITVWGSGNTAELNRLRRLINNAIKLLPAPPNLNVAEISKLNFILDFDNSYRYFVLVKMFKIIVYNSHSYFSEKIAADQVNHRHATRFKARGNLTLPLLTKSKSQRSFLYRGLNMWNEITEDLRDINDVIVFKKCLKVSIVESL
jgi:hypothetical protein